MWYQYLNLDNVLREYPLLVMTEQLRIRPLSSWTLSHFNSSCLVHILCLWKAKVLTSLRNLRWLVGAFAVRVCHTAPLLVSVRTAECTQVDVHCLKRTARYMNQRATIFAQTSEALDKNCTGCTKTYLGLFVGIWHNAGFLCPESFLCWWKFIVFSRYQLLSLIVASSFQFSFSTTVL